MTSDNLDKKIIQSWRKNAKPWAKAIQSNQIESRAQVTNQTIVDAITSYKPNTVLDIGCGEGWLCRELETQGIQTFGIDVIPELIEQAKVFGGGCFQQMSYEGLAANGLNQRFDLVVCNFSLLGKESVEDVFQAVPRLLNPNGYFIIQTLHPLTACGDQEYKDGWRKGSWDGFSDEFSDPAPWYFRTLDSWQKLFSINHFKKLEIFEPEVLATGEKASLVLIARCDKRKWV